MSEPRTKLEHVRCLQAMLFQTEAGELLRDLFMAAGHFREYLDGDRERIEQNLVKHLMEWCGITPEFKPISLPADEPGTGNVIDDTLER